MLKKFKILIFVVSLISVFATANLALAQLDLGLEYGAQTGLSEANPWLVAANIIRIVLGFLGILAVCLVLYAGFIYMTAGGDAEKLNKAKAILKNAVIGIVIILSSFALVSFIISRLLDATGAGGGGAGGVCGEGGACGDGLRCCDGYCWDSCGSGGNPFDSVFRISNTSPKPTATNVVRNARVRVVFNKQLVDLATTTIADNFVVEKIGDVNPDTGAFALATTTSITGSLATSSREIVFTANGDCGGASTSTVCLPEWSRIKVKINSASGIKSINDHSLTCSPSSPCEFEFSTDNRVDLVSPTASVYPSQICAAENGVVLVAGKNKVSGRARDDNGLSGLYFYEWNGVTAPTSYVHFETGNSNRSANSYYFATSTRTAGETINFKIEAKDLADNLGIGTSTATVRPGHCCDGKQGDGETGVDCGGACDVCGKATITSVSPVGGFCSNDNSIFCRSNADCGAGNTCDNNTPNNKIGGLVTIGGDNFGTSTGEVYFSSATTSGWVEVDLKATADACSGVSAWLDNQIIVVVPEGVAEGPIKIITANNQEDSTEDGNGPVINDFQITAFDRPGLCSLSPNHGLLNASVDFGGINLQNSYAMFGNINQFATSSSLSTDSTLISAVVPGLRTGTTTAFALKGNIPSNYLYFHKDAEAGIGPEITGFSPAQGAPGQYVTIFGRGFGRVKGVGFDVYFASSTDPNTRIKADYSFSPACANSVWRDDRVIVKVPTGIANSDYLISIELGTTTNTIDTRGLASSTFEVDNDLDLAPSLCAISPETTQNNKTVSFYGEYFSAMAVPFFYNEKSSTLDSYSSSNNQSSASSTVPANAITGPVYLKQGNLAGNSLNLKIGTCSADADCGTGVCCLAGSVYTGECKEDANACNLAITSSVYEWEFVAKSGPGDNVFKGPRIDYFEPLVGNTGQYLTIYGSGFGADRASSSVWFATSTAGADIKEANYDFPSACAENVWSDTRIVVKVPEISTSTAGFISGDYYLRVKTPSSTINSSTVIETETHKKLFTASSTASLLPQFCKISPLVGPIGSVVNIYGEYFNNTSTTTFNDLKTSSVYNFNIDQLSASSTVPVGAITGPVYLTRDGYDSNSLNFTVGNCSAKTPCGDNLVCCGAKTYFEGQCKATSSECNLSVTSSVYEWEFTTGPAVGPSTCSGYDLNQCSNNLTCPNSPGMCSPYNVTAVASGNDCNYDCNTVNVCKTDNCVYDSTIKKCKKIIKATYKEGGEVDVATSTPSCSLKSTTTPIALIDGGATKVYERTCDGTISRWKILTSTSCPVGWQNQGKENNLNKCIQSGDDGICIACSTGFSCVKSGADGVCAVDKEVCPRGEFCDDKETPNNLSDDKCMKPQTGSCECCCRKDNSDQDCCFPTKCEGTCGSDLTNNQNKFGYCSGCAVFNDDGETLNVNASNARCNCTGHTNKICTVDSVHPTGICKDNVCLPGETMCNTAEGSKCCKNCQTIGNSQVCTDSLSSCSGYNLGQCAVSGYCPNSPGQCSSRSTSTVSTTISCDAPFCKETYSSICASSTDQNANNCSYDSNVNKCKLNSGSCFSVSNSITTINKKNIKVNCGIINGDAKWFYSYASSTGDVATGTLFISTSTTISSIFTASSTTKQFIADGDHILNGKFCVKGAAGSAVEVQCGSVGNQPKWYYNTSQNCLPEWIRDSRGNCAISSYQNISCSYCPAGTTCEKDQCVVGSAVCTGGSSCVGGKCQKTINASCECCCDKTQNNPTTQANPACCNNLTCGYMCGDNTDVASSTGKGKCTGCATDADCNCPGTSGKYCDQTAVPGVVGGICRDCSELPTSADCSDHSSVCCVDAMRSGVCRGGNGVLGLNNYIFNKNNGFGGYSISPGMGNCTSTSAVENDNLKISYKNCDYMILNIPYIYKRGTNIKISVKASEIEANSTSSSESQGLSINKSLSSNTLSLDFSLESNNSWKNIYLNEVKIEDDSAYCAYYHCNANNNGCATSSPVFATSTAYSTIYYSQSQCAAACQPAPSLGSRCVKVATTTPGSSQTEQCDTSICKGFTCLTETGSSTAATTGSDCGICCCDPRAATDQCKAINSKLKCVAGRGDCSGNNRGLCCGCKLDSDCGNSDGCGTDTCCYPHPIIKEISPVDNKVDVCRNSQIQASADRLIDPATIAGNVFLVGAYPDGNNCPEDTNLVAQGEQQAPTKFFARLVYKTKIIAKAMVRPVFKLFGSESALAQQTIVNYCAVAGTSDYYNTGEQYSETVITFTPSRMLDANKDYYAIIKSEVKSVDGVGITGQNKTGIDAFEQGDFAGSYAWNFTTLSEDLNAGICDVDHVTLEPESYLFKTTKNDIVNENDTDKNNKTFDTVADSDKVFIAKARSADEQVLVPFSDYNWSWNWISTKNSVADFINSPTNLASSSRLVRAIEGIVDDRTNIVAQASVNGSNITKSATSTAYVFVCENPWPPISNFGTWSPWKDVSGSNATNYELYYCRDAGKVGTADDLPAVESDHALVGATKKCSYGNNMGKSCSDDKDCAGAKCVTQSLRDVYYFRGALPNVNVSGGSFLRIDVDNNFRVNKAEDKIGNRVTLAWSEIAASSNDVLREYKIYYGTASRNYSSSLKATTTTYTFDKLTNGTKYYFAITAVYVSGAESAYSNEAVAIPWDSVGPSPAPTFGNIATTTDGKLSVSWTDGSNGDAKYYELLYKISDTCDSNTVFQPGVKTDKKTYNLSNLREGTKYCLGLVSYDQYNNKSVTSTKSWLYYTNCDSLSSGWSDTSCVDGFYGNSVPNKIYQAYKKCTKTCLPGCDSIKCDGDSVTESDVKTICSIDEFTRVINKNTKYNSNVNDCMSYCGERGYEGWLLSTPDNMCMCGKSTSSVYSNNGNGGRCTPTEESR